MVLFADRLLLTPLQDPGSAPELLHLICGPPGVGLKAGKNHRKDLVVDLLVSLTSGAILALGSQGLAVAVLPRFGGALMPWLFVVVTLIVALLAFFFARRLYKGPDQAFVVMSALTQTRWLGDVLEHLSRLLDRHGIDLVVKLSPYDHRGRNQLSHLAALSRRRRSYIGGFVVPARPECVGHELVAFCEAIARPVVFVDVSPFINSGDYPKRAAFVGCDPEEIGTKSAQWVVRELSDRGVESPSVLVVGGDGQTGRHEKFAERLKEMLPSASLEINLLGRFSREESRKIVGSHLRRLRPGKSLDVIFCTNDEMALGAVDAIQENKGSSDLLIVGVDGIAEAIAAINAGKTPFRATIVQDPRHVAEVAVDLLLKLRSGEDVRTVTSLPTTVYPGQ